MPNSRKGKRSSTKNKLLIAFIVLVFVACLTSFLYYSLVFGYENEKITFLLISLFISSFIGGIVFIPSHLEFLKDQNYNFATATSNYFLMLTESSIMLLGFTLSTLEAGWYSQWFLIMLYLFFGIHLFSYPRSLKQSLSALSSHIMFILLNLIGDPNRMAETIIPLLAKAGYIFSLALIIAGFLMFFKPWISSRKNSSERQNSKILAIFSGLYTLFILLPGLWYLLPGLENYFESSSTLLLILSIFYFIYTLIEKVRSLTGEMIRFISVEKVSND
jgi:uncharacterized membrane protein YfcA